MTAVLDPPTEESTDLSTERWEVQTSIPVAVTGDFDGMLMSHAEQAEGDFPIELGDAQEQELLGQLLGYARDEMGMRSVDSAILFHQGIPVTGYVDERRLQNETATQALRSLLASFVEQSSGIARMAQRTIVEDLIEQFPVPTFGSPPSGWTTIGNMVAKPGSFFAGVGIADWTDSPVMMIIGGGVIAVFWFFKPVIMAKRRSLGQRAASKWGTELRPGDE